MDIKKLAREVFEIEAKEIASLSHKLTDDFENAIHAIHQSGAAEDQNNQTSTIITLTTNNNQICPVCKKGRMLIVATGNGRSPPDINVIKRLQIAMKNSLV